jgi:hypothetical protein
MRKREDTSVELEKWRTVFSCSRDYFDETGLDPHKWEPPHGTLRGAELEAAEARFLDAMRDAWGRLGAMFLKEPKGPLDEKVPFAFYAFGDPAKPRRPRRSLQELRAAHSALWWAAVRREQQREERKAYRKAGITPAILRTWQARHRAFLSASSAQEPQGD